MDDFQGLVEHFGPGPGVQLLAERGEFFAAVVEPEAHPQYHPPVCQQVEGGELASYDPRPPASQGRDHGAQPQPRRDCTHSGQGDPGVQDEVSRGAVLDMVPQEQAVPAGPFGTLAQVRK